MILNLTRCEYNHHLSPYLAEPWNAITSLAYCVAAVLAYSSLKKNMEAHLALALLSLFLIGIGSFCFHGTLTYRMQLLDELPMVSNVSGGQQNMAFHLYPFICALYCGCHSWLQMYLILTAVWGLYERNDVTPSTSGKLRAALLGTFCAGATVMLLATPKASLVHVVAKTFMILAFAASFVYVFYGGSVGESISL